MLSAPEGRVEVDSFATPALIPVVPRVFVPEVKVTVPVTKPPNCGVTVAVKVTVCLGLEGFGDETRVVVVPAWFTTWFRGVEVLVANEAFPLYTAVIDSVPAANFVVV